MQAMDHKTARSDVLQKTNRFRSLWKNKHIKTISSPVRTKLDCRTGDEKLIQHHAEQKTEAFHIFLSKGCWPHSPAR